MVSNFSFLQEKFPALARLGTLAEQYCFADANSALIKIGMLGETIINLMFRFDKLTVYANSTAKDKIDQLEAEGLVDRELCAIMHALRKSRNKAAHEGYDDVSACKVMLKMGYSLASWFMETYGDYNYQAVPYRELIPEAAASAKVEQQNDNKKTEEEETERLTQADLQRASESKQMPKAERVAKSQAAAIKRPKTEAETRYLIDEQLRQVGWEADTANLRYGKGTRPQKNKNMAIAEWPTDSKISQKGYADYALFIGMKLYGILEAKKWDTDVSSVIDFQCKDYASNIKQRDEMYLLGAWDGYRVPFVFASNGRPYLQQLPTKSGIWFADLRKKTNQAKALHGWFSPLGLKELYEKDNTDGNQKLAALSYDFLRDKDGLNLRPYQLRAIEKVEEAVLSGKRTALLAMATGTGKTRIVLGMIYRFLKTGCFKRILFLVDRNALGVQAQDTFKEVKLENLRTLGQIYNIKELEDKFIDTETKVHVATVQGMVKRIMYPEVDEKIPAISDYDLLIIDEAHRGYILDKDMSEAEDLYRDQREFQSKYRYITDYFDAVKIGLTATPALHTTAIFGEPVFTYSYREAVTDGYLIDHDAPHQLATKLSNEGIIINKGSLVKFYDPKTGTINTAQLPDELEFDVEHFNKDVIVPAFNRAVLEEIANDLAPTERNRGKTLIFAVNDAHADLIVQLLKEIYQEQGLELDNDAIMKITGSVANGDQKRIQEKIKRFKNEQYPNIVVTVDLLTTGIDVPEITTLVFLRCVKSRILFEQMLGRATRQCPEINKDHFEIYDPVGVYKSLQDVTNMPTVVNTTISLADLLDSLQKVEAEATADIIVQIVAKLQRMKRKVEEDKLQAFADSMGCKLDEFMQKVRSLPTEEAKALLIKHRAELLALTSFAHQDRVILVHEGSDHLLYHTRGYGKDGEEIRPGDYLHEFQKFIQNHMNEVDALNITCTRPKDLKPQELKELLKLLDENGFTALKLNTAYSNANNVQMTAGIIALIRRYALNSTLVDKKSQISRAMNKLMRNHNFTGTQKAWLDKIKAYMENQEILSTIAFEDDTRLKQDGGFKRFNKIFANDLQTIIDEFNGYLYDDGGQTA